MGSLSRLLLAAALLLALVLAALAGWSLGRRGSGPVEAKVSSEPVVTAVREVAKLATVEIEVADVVRYEEVKTVVVFDIPKNATLRLRGRVLGGFDLGTGFAVTADEASRTLRIALPLPQILAVDDRIEWFDERSGWLNPITPQDRTRWTAWARGALGRAAKDAGLASRAERHARELLTKVAAAYGWKAVVTVTGGPSPAPVSP